MFSCDRVSQLYPQTPGSFSSFSMTRRRTTVRVCNPPPHEKDAIYKGTEYWRTYIAFPAEEKHTDYKEAR
jgi:hypothetical protein